MTLSTARRTVSKRLAGLEIPEAFQAATVSAAVNALDRTTVSAKASRRRLNDKVRAIQAVAL